VKKDTSVNIRLTSGLRAELQRLADEDGRKLSAYIERLLQLHVRTARLEAPGLMEASSPFSGAEKGLDRPGSHPVPQGADQKRGNLRMPAAPPASPGKKQE
jgi:hypothetical protein